MIVPDLWVVLNIQEFCNGRACSNRLADSDSVSRTLLQLIGMVGEISRRKEDGRLYGSETTS